MAPALFWALLGLLPAVILGQTTCSNYGSANGTQCACPPGFAGSTCAEAACGGTIFQGLSRPLASTTNGFSNITTCPCQDGWGGVGCNTCQTNQACQSGYNSVFGDAASTAAATGVDATLQCNTAARVYASGEMSCQVINPTLQALYPGRTALNILRTLDPSLSTLRNISDLGDKGSIRAQLWYNDVETFYCQASDCTQTEDSESGAVSWQCNNLSCTCIPGSTFCGASPVRPSNLLSLALF
ncbi:hypothetical protein M407DRAFT_22614 [Tulasnella calospora MUT 4182]|uniref:EGF-like domain-containing protein n=1 Tax=Tulasnella calospora MUT 4182 TaxID=1051891 RepID=A0A0C3L312_9AGAM|nr:hypothetical protein M407DRAFT_22614 [Tulasnella calospora MUT 4182]